MHISAAVQKLYRVRKLLFLQLWIVNQPAKFFTNMAKILFSVLAKFRPPSTRALPTIVSMPIIQRKVRWTLCEMRSEKEDTPIYSKNELLIKIFHKISVIILDSTVWNRLAFGCVGDVRAVAKVAKIPVNFQFFCYVYSQWEFVI